MISIRFTYPDGTDTTSTWTEPEPKWKMQHAAWMRDALYWSEQEVPDVDTSDPGVPADARFPVVPVCGGGTR